jgi:hypothetical protein
MNGRISSGWDLKPDSNTPKVVFSLPQGSGKSTRSPRGRMVALSLHLPRPVGIYVSIGFFLQTFKLFSKRGFCRSLSSNDFFLAVPIGAEDSIIWAGWSFAKIGIDELPNQFAISRHFKDAAEVALAD